MQDDTESADIGLIGMAVMGQNLVLNMADHGFKVAVFNRTVSKVHDFLEGPAKGKSVCGADNVETFVKLLKIPRKVILLVQAGRAVDNMIEQLLPHFQKGDIIIDGGNSLYTDTMRRYEDLTSKGILFVGMGVSGGEEGARFGPSLMPGGCKEAWPLIKDILQAIAAKVDNEPCCEWMGDAGAGHFVKMVHNGIEYGDMQLICEAFNVMKEIMHLDYGEIGEVFEAYNKTELDSYLIEITANVMKFKDSDGSYLISKIRDSAGQKGTGKWTAMASLDLGVPTTLITEAVYARFLSSMIDERAVASELIPKDQEKKAPVSHDGREEMTEHLRRALLSAKIISYAQGFMLLRAAAKQYKWELNYGDVAMVWRGGCIIRSVLLGHIKNAFDKDPNLSCLLLDQYFVDEMKKCVSALRFIIAAAISQSVPVPCMSSGLSFYDGYRSKWLPANLIQALRDYFGAHTYELLDQPGVFHHTNWTGTGGNVTSSTYNA